jgi:hypothetical protein
MVVRAVSDYVDDNRAIPRLMKKLYFDMEELRRRFSISEYLSGPIAQDGPRAYANNDEYIAGENRERVCPVEIPAEPQESRGNQATGDHEGQEEARTSEEWEEDQETAGRQEPYTTHSAMASIPLREEQDMLRNRASEINSNPDGCSLDISNRYQGSHNGSSSNRYDRWGNSNGNGRRRRRDQPTNEPAYRHHLEITLVSPEYLEHMDMAVQRIAESRERAEKVQEDRNTMYSRLVESKIAYTTVLRENAREEHSWNREDQPDKRRLLSLSVYREEEAYLEAMAKRAFKERLYGSANKLLDRAEELLQEDDLNGALDVFRVLNSDGILSQRPGANN